jgi:hypothetical protein
MQGRSFSRRDFLKLSGLAWSSLAWRSVRATLPPEDQAEPLGVGRVTASGIRIYQEPSFKSERLGWRARDRLVDIIDEFDSPHGPAYNPRWYRVVGGYAHSGYLQRVEAAHLNEPLRWVPEEGRLGEVTVPYTQSMRYLRGDNWQPLYRLYYSSVYWITSLDEEPDGEAWYGLTDDRLRVVYHVPAAHIRPIQPAEIRPISPHVPPEEKRIQVSIAEQTLTAYEGDQAVLRAKISSGLPTRGPTLNGIPTETPPGNYNISLKVPSRHMGDGELTDSLEAYELPGVPWVSFFHSYGIGFHGTYWHDNFGTRMSHGCVNMRNEDAKWLFRWTTPEIDHTEWYRLGRGTPVQVV